MISKDIQEKIEEKAVSFSKEYSSKLYEQLKVQGIYMAGEKFGYSLAEAELKEKAKELEEKDKEIDRLKNMIKEFIDCDFTSGTHLSCALIKAKQLLK